MALKITKNLKSFYKHIYNESTFHNKRFENQVKNFPELQDVFKGGKNIWIFKPCDMNRGRGV